MTNKPQIRPELEVEEILSEFQREFDRCGGNYKYNRKPVIEKLVDLIATIEERAEKRGLKQLKQRIKDEVLYHPINGNEKQDTQYIALEKVFKDI